MQLILHREMREKTRHPMQRIMAIEKNKRGTSTLATTTDIHLARNIGEALRR